MSTFLRVKTGLARLRNGCMRSTVWIYRFAVVKRWGLLANPAVEKYAGATVDGHVETQSGKLFSPW